MPRSFVDPLYLGMCHQFTHVAKSGQNSAGCLV